MEIATIVTTSLCGYIVWYLQKHTCFKDDTRTVNKILLRSELRQRHKQLMIDGEIEAWELTELIELHSIYKKLNGNGSGDRMIAEIKTLKLKGD